MRVLHLLSDYRWTGVAEPVAGLVAALRDEGLDVTLACRRPPRGVDPKDGRLLVTQLERRGIEPVTDFALDRYAPHRALVDAPRLRRFIGRRGIDVVHAHLSHDHLVALLASCVARRHRVVRSVHKCVPLRGGVGNRLVYRRLTDAYCGFSRRVCGLDARALGLPEERVFVVGPAVDLERFTPDQPRADVRADLGFSGDDVVVGVVARLQPHRRFDVLFEAFRRARQRVPALRLVLLGGGTRAQQVVFEPIRTLGIEDAVRATGRRGDDYEDHLATFDLGVLLVPGSDGTCRAVREMMAMGKPVIVSRRGMLEEMVPDGRAGLVIDDTPEKLAEALVTMAGDAELRRRMGRAARDEAVARFCPAAQARGVASMYEAMLANR